MKLEFNRILMLNLLTMLILIISFTNVPVAGKSEFSGTWTNKPHKFASPSPRSASAAAFHPTFALGVMFGGKTNFNYFNETWRYNPQVDAWSLAFPTQAPSKRAYAALTYSNEADLFFLYGGSDGSALADMWTYDLNTNNWTEIFPSNSPSARSTQMVYISVTDQLFIYGGASGVRYGDTWVYDYPNNQWTNLQPATQPLFLNLYGITYDIKYNKVIMFGGFTNGYSSSKTYVYDFDLDDWIDINPPNSPPALKQLQMVYDTNIQKSVLFGGESQEKINDTWVYDYGENMWTLVDVDEMPESRDDHTMIFDSFNNETIMFGGVNSSHDYLNDTWQLTLNEESVTVSSQSSSSVSSTSSTGGVSESDSDSLSILHISSLIFPILAMIIFKMKRKVSSWGLSYRTSI